MWAMLLDHGADLSSIRVAIAGGGPIPPELVRRVEAASGGRMSILFGMTELCGTATAVYPDDDQASREHSCGHPLPGVEVRVVGSAGQVLAAGAVGEVQVRGWLTMSGYFEEAAATARTLLPGGWLRTGDVGWLDESDRLHVSGRLKEMIIRGGRTSTRRRSKSSCASTPRSPTPPWSASPTSGMAKRSPPRSCLGLARPRRPTPS
jgi:long-subunit acyl-CoA synthetase (AMP-forming)